MTVKKKTSRRSLDLAGTTTKYWAFARGGAWRNPKPTGGPYICEQCRLDACGGNDATLTMQAVTTIELAPADVCANCGAQLLEEQEVKEGMTPLLGSGAPAQRKGGCRSASDFVSHLIAFDSHR